MYRVVKQGRIALAYYIKDVTNGRIPKAINTIKFANYIAERTDWKLVHVTTPHLKALRGVLLCKSNIDQKEALVLISDGENNSTCWQRFTLVKEICHLFLQHEKSVKSDNALEMAQSLMKHVMVMPEFLPQLNGVVKPISEDDLKSTFEEDIKSTLLEAKDDSEEFDLEKYLARVNPHGAEESSALVAAIEIMIPPSNIEWLTKNIENGDSLYKLANELKVPKLILEHRLNEWGLKIPIT